MGSTSSEEVVWRKSSFSNISGECVEVARLGQTVLLRDSRQPEGAVLTFSLDEWRDFLANVAHGELSCTDTI